jgi:deazaflavin-dependent oxidoreductase (nitroreductase family)
MWQCGLVWARFRRNYHYASAFHRAMQMRFILTATGAKSGKPRAVALLGIPHPDGVAVVAANYGDAKHPAWYHKLKANPAATVVKCEWVSAT